MHTTESDAPAGGQPAPSPTSPTEAIVARIERSPLLESWSARIQPVVERAVAAAGPRRDLLTGARLGHPAHPALVAGPLGCWTGSVVLDLVGGRGARRAARRLVGAGILAALPAVATGAADWIDTRGAERRVASAHAAGNAFGTALFSASWLLRRRRHRLGAGVGLLAAVVVSAAGYLGGHLTYRRGVGVNTTAFEAGPTGWTPLVLADDPDPDRMVAATVTAVPLVVVGRAAGAPHVLEDRCTHRGGPLHEGTVEGPCVVCPWHASRFDLVTGEVRSGPATAPQPVYEVRRADGTVEVRRDEPGDLRRNPVR